MAIKGSLKEASLPDVLQLLSLGQKTGCLSLTDRTNLGYIYFNAGRITYASIVNRRDRLGDLLLKSGKITKEQLDEGVALQEEDRDKRLGAILVQMGAVTRDDLEEQMRLQIEEAVFFLFTWTRGSFQFEVEVQPEAADFTLSINPEALLLEGARRIDEWSLIEKKIPSFDLVFALDNERIDASDAELTENQQFIRPLVDGQRDVAALVEAAGRGEFAVGKALFGLITAGFAHKVTVSARAEASPAAAARIEEHRNLGIAFYRTGMLEEASREFKRVTDLNPRHAHALFFQGLVHVQLREWAEAATSFRAVRELGPPKAVVLHNLAVSLENLGEFDEADQLFGLAVDADQANARILTGWGVAAFKREEYERAADRLDRARSVAGEQKLPEMWFWMRALVAAAQTDGETAERITEEGLLAHPGSAVLRNNLAVLLEHSGQLDRAENELKEAISSGHTLPQLFKNLGDIQYRRARYDEAWDAYEQATRIAPDLGDDLYFKLGNIAYKRGDYDAAASMWMKTLERNPDHQLARTNLDTMTALQG